METTPYTVTVERRNRYDVTIDPRAATERALKLFKEKTNGLMNEVRNRKHHATPKQKAKRKQKQVDRERKFAKSERQR